MCFAAEPPNKAGWWSRLKRRGRRLSGSLSSSDLLAEQPAAGENFVSVRHSLRPRRSLDDNSAFQWE